MNLCGVGILNANMLIKYSICTCSRMLFCRIYTRTTGAFGIWGRLFVWSRWACMNLFLSF